MTKQFYTLNPLPVKRILLITLIISTSLSLLANDTLTYKNEIRVSISSSKLKFNPINYYSSIQLGNFNFNQLSYNRMINDFISAGGYLGYGSVDQIIEEIWDNIYGYSSSRYSVQEKKSTMEYGINGKLHFLPLILKNNTSRFDLYLSGDIGLISIFTTVDESIYPKRGTYFDYSILGGASVFLFKRKRIGMIIEAGYRKFKYHHGSSLRIGINYRL